ncbi:retrotransposon ORF1 [Tanacetum coccineum]
MFVLMVSYFIRVMDPNSSLGKICLGEDVVVISRDKVEGSRDWNSLEFQDTANNGKKKGMVFYQMDTEEVSDRFVASCFVNGLEAYDVKKELIVALRGEIYFVKFIINLEEDDVEPGVIFGRLFLRLTKAITDFGARIITIYPDIDPFLEETKEEGKSNDDWDHLLDFNIDDIPLLGEEGLSPFVCKMGKSSRNKKQATENLNFFYQDMRTSSSAELDGKIVKEEEETVKRIKGEALKEKEDPRAFILPIRLEGQANENALADTGSDINTMPFHIYVQLGRDDMKKVDRGITMINHTQAEAMGILTNVLCQVGVTTLIAKFLILDILIDRDSPIVVGRGFLRTIGGIVNAPERLFSTFDGLCHQTFRAARSDFMRNTESEVEHTMMRLDHHDPNAQDNMKPWKNYCIHKFTMSFCYGKDVAEMQSLEINDMLRIRLREAGSNEEIFTSVAWFRAFNINETIYTELCHEFYTTYEFNEVCADDELQSKKIIKFILGGRAHNLTLLEFARRLGLYQAIELEEEGFNVYFEGGLRNDDNFNAHEYWLSISREDNLGLSRSHTSTIRSLVLRVIHKMITYDLCQRMTGYDKIQKNDLWLLSMFDARHQNGYANMAWLIARWMKRK